MTVFFAGFFILAGSGSSGGCSADLSFLFGRGVPLTGGVCSVGRFLGLGVPSISRLALFSTSACGGSLRCLASRVRGMVTSV